MAEPATPPPHQAARQAFPEPQQCGYHENNRPCRTAPVYEVKLDGRELLLCGRHARPEFWPPDLRKKLPSRLKRLAVSLRRQYGDHDSAVAPR